MRKMGIALGALALLALGLMQARRLAPVDRGPGAKGKLGELRSALSNYYSDSGGHYPASLDALVPKYLPEIPQLSELREHAPSRAVLLVGELVPRDSGGWLYVNDPASKNYGEVRIDCTHTDGRRAWFDF